MQTIARLTKYSIKYYNDTANEAQQAVMDRQSSQRRIGRVLHRRRDLHPRAARPGDRVGPCPRTHSRFSGCIELTSHFVGVRSERRPDVGVNEWTSCAAGFGPSGLMRVAYPIAGRAAPPTPPAPSPSKLRSRCRPRHRRDKTVPIGVFMIEAISLHPNPSISA